MSLMAHCHCRGMLRCATPPPKDLRGTSALRRRKSYWCLLIKYRILIMTCRTNQHYRQGCEILIWSGKRFYTHRADFNIAQATGPLEEQPEAVLPLPVGGEAQLGHQGTGPHVVDHTGERNCLYDLMYSLLYIYMIKSINYFINNLQDCINSPFAWTAGAHRCRRGRRWCSPWSIKVIMTLHCLQGRWFELDMINISWFYEEVVRVYCSELSWRPCPRRAIAQNVRSRQEEGNNIQLFPTTQYVFMVQNNGVFNLRDKLNM